MCFRHDNLRKFSKKTCCFKHLKLLNLALPYYLSVTVFGVIPHVWNCASLYIACKLPRRRAHNWLYNLIFPSVLCYMTLLCAVVRPWKFGGHPHCSLIKILCNLLMNAAYHTKSRAGCRHVEVPGQRLC